MLFTLFQMKCLNKSFKMRFQIIVRLFSIMLFLFCVFWGLTSCYPRNTKQKVDVPETNHQLLFPDSMLIINIYQKPELTKTNDYLCLNAPAIVTSIWGDCHVCLKKSKYWDEFYQTIDYDELKIIYIINTNFPEYFVKIFYTEINSPDKIFLIDSTKSFLSLNKLSMDQTINNSFLVDKNFNIILQGDPIVNMTIQQEYVSTISVLKEKKQQ